MKNNSNNSQRKRERRSHWMLRRSYVVARIAEEYINNPDEYVSTFTVQINGKKRHIITYSHNKNGAALRKVHEYLATIVSGCYKSTPNSFAYKPGTGILPCLEKHIMSNTFLKTDIHEFFNSIQYEILLEQLYKDNVCRRMKKRVKLLLKACFYDGHLPIGFVTSPVLSDLYMHNIDELFLNREDIIYTRYADDFIISGIDNVSALEQVKLELEEALSEYSLELNTKKTYFRTLRYPGDALHVLGVNLVNNAPEPNRITVSDKYIRETSKDICQLLEDSKGMTNEEIEEKLTSIVGKIEFIRYFSMSSYNKLEKMVSIKYGEKVDLSRKNLCAFIKTTYNKEVPLPIIDK